MCCIRVRTALRQQLRNYVRHLYNVVKVVCII